jgi:hypothetical protein
MCWGRGESRDELTGIDFIPSSANRCVWYYINNQSLLDAVPIGPHYLAHTIRTSFRPFDNAFDSKV